MTNRAVFDRMEQRAQELHLSAGHVADSFGRCADRACRYRKDLIDALRPAVQVAA